MARTGVGLVTSGHFRLEAVTAVPRLSLTRVTRRSGASHDATDVGKEAQR